MKILFMSEQNPVFDLDHDLLYDQEYYENGIAAGVSMYENYRWLPDLTMRMAHFLVLGLPIAQGSSILDFGCAKGYLVKALRLFNIQAFGCDISSYAIDCADPVAKPFCRCSDQKNPIPFASSYFFDWLIAKDVFEHLDEDYLHFVLQEASSRCDKIFSVVPLGENDRFIIPDYEKDATHVLAKTPSWWKQTFLRSGWRTTRFQYSMAGMKENWALKYPHGNGLFTLEKG